MNSSNPLALTLTSISSNEENEDLTMIQSKRADFFATYHHQNFSLPDSIMFYITKNPTTPELYQKMIQTCKDFFVKNPILIFSVLDYTRDGWCVNKKPFDLDKLTTKVWITSGFHVQPDSLINTKDVNENIASSIIPKIFRCDVKYLTLFDQIISVDDLCLLISSAEWIQLTNVTVKENDGTIVGIEKIVEVSVKAKSIQIHKPPITSVTSKTMKELVQIPHFSELNICDIIHIPEAFDIEAFYVYMKKNQHTSFILVFDDSISDAYKNRIEEIVDEIIVFESRGYKFPFITFPGMPEEKEQELLNIQYNNFLMKVVG